MNRYGWIQDAPDARDVPYAYTAIPEKLLPPRVDLRAGCPPVYDQGQLGSCTANAIAAALEFDAMRQGQPAVPPSRLFIYYNERVMEGTVALDAGAQIRDGIKSVAHLGACPESQWPYVESQFAVKPLGSDYADALKHTAVAYRKVTPSALACRMALAKLDCVVFGFTVYSSFESDIVAQTGVVPLPAPDEEILGGHAVLMVGYDKPAARFICRNSWGSSWGDKGYFTLPWEYLAAGRASDFWVISVVR